jgi:hypothetical protein
MYIGQLVTMGLVPPLFLRNLNLDELCSCIDYGELLPSRWILLKDRSSRRLKFSLFYQTYFYFVHYPKDGHGLKFTVIL